MNLNRFKPLVILTGAGISAESGIKTFRASDGLWEEHAIEDVATPEGFERDPALVHRFYNDRRRHLLNSEVMPNAAHMALAELEQNWEGPFLLVTQNVDDLHERAGSKQLLHMHGKLKSVFCASCDHRADWQNDLSTQDVCIACGRIGAMRPDIVWFGERPYHMETIDYALASCEIFISIGTSGLVYPAAGFVAQVRRQASGPARRCIEVNLDASEISAQFTEHRTGLASIEVPKLVLDLLTSDDNRLK